MNASHVELFPVSASTGRHVNRWVRAPYVFSTHENKEMAYSSGHFSSLQLLSLQCTDFFL